MFQQRAEKSDDAAATEVSLSIKNFILMDFQVDHVIEKEIVHQKQKEKIHTSATEDENATDDRQKKEKQDHESDDHQSAQTALDRVDVRKRIFPDINPVSLRTNIIVPISTANLKTEL